MRTSTFLSRLLVVLRKELLDAFRDRRALVTILISAVLAPALIAFMLNRIADRQREVEDVTIPVVGMENAPAFLEWLRQQAGVEIVAGPVDAERAVRERREEVVVVIPKDFGEKFAVSRPATIQLVSDGSNNASRPKIERVRDLLRRYSAQIGSLRLIGRGVSPAIVSALQVEEVEVSSAQQRAARILAFIPMFIVLAGFIAAMQIAMDSTAGERERGSLEPLLVNPAPRAAIAGGKWLAASCTSMLSVLITTALCLTIMRTVPLQELGIRFRLGPSQVGGMLAAILPLCPFAAASQIYLATFARSFKEAQSYMGLLIMIPMLPGMLSTLYPMSEKLWMYAIPMLGQHMLMTDVLGGRSPAPIAFAIAAAASLGAALIFVRLTTELFRREKIIFGR